MRLGLYFILNLNICICNVWCFCVTKMRQHLFGYLALHKKSSQALHLIKYVKLTDVN